MRKNIKNLICLIMTLGLILSLAACGNAGSSTENNSPAAPSGETSSQAAEADNKTTPEQTDGSVTENSCSQYGRQ
jgi:ABC-type oligopeptide transport system substrate-binding subunit